MPSENISSTQAYTLPNGISADLIRPDLIYIERSINGYEGNKFVCRIIREKLSPALLELCMRKRDFDAEPLYLQHANHIEKCYRVKGIIIPDSEWVWFWEDGTGIWIDPMSKLIRHSVAEFDSSEQDMILLEEMLELGLELLHRRRNRTDRAHIVEELAHVMISSQVWKQVYQITDDEINAEAEKKLQKYGWSELTV